MKTQYKVLAIITTLILVTLACSTQTGNPTTPPNTGLVQTQVAMAMTQTAMAGPQLPPQDNGNISLDPSLQQTQVAMSMTQTALAIPPVAPTITVSLPTVEPTKADIKALIKNSNILIYEDMIDYPQYITIVSKALKKFDAHKVYVGDAIGTLMEQLNSGTHWDLIIIAAESRGAVSGDYWSVIKNQVDDGVGLITEIWYLDDIGDGKISPLLYECGVDVQKDWYRAYGDDRLKYDMYWAKPDSPVFNTPNRVTSFSASLSEPAWNGDIGDLMQLIPGSKATILASHIAGEDSTTYGTITSCMEGRMIMQTFDSHDYPTDPMVALWQNYIMYTLTNHFNQ